MLKSSGRRIDLSQPFVDAMLPEGHRLHVVLEGISRGLLGGEHPQVRRCAAARLARPRRARQPDRPARRAFLEASVRAGLNIVVAGGTQAGKTTMLNCLAAAIPGGDRVVSVEEVFELRFSHPDWVAMQTRQAGLEGTGEITLRDLVKESLRMRPTRIIVGEVRAEECLDLLLALNAGLPGMARCTPTPRGRRWSRCAPCRCWRGRTSRRASSCPTVAVVGRPRRAPGHRRRRRTPGRRDRRRCRAGSRTTSSRPSRSSCATRRRAACGTAGMPPRLERYERVGIDVHAHAEREAR